ncbi:MAG: endolytic transglycosylase MltG [Actinomycetota bacterium]
MIDPLIKIRKTEDQPAENWYDDPWDSPDALRRSEQLEIDELPNDFRGLSRPFQIVAAAVAVVTLFMGAIGMWYVHQVNPSGKGDPQSFTVVEGDSISSVGQRLEKSGFITSASVFTWYVSRKGGIELIPGYYTISPKDHMGNIMAILKTPPSATYQKVTFPEGYTIAQMGSRLAEKTLRLNADQFVAMANDPSVEAPYRPAGQTSLEGLLFPDTYQISGDQNELQVVQQLAKQMVRVASQEGIDDSQAKVGLTPYKVLIVASMIEREAKVDADRAKIARVIYNRLEIKMPLQIDATLLYNAVAGADFATLKATDTPYNTYINKGLPPTPIANPGRASIIAALNPAPNPAGTDPMCANVPKPCRYLYYVLSDKEGGHAFAVTLAQHEANVAAARQAGLLP